MMHPPNRGRRLMVFVAFVGALTLTGPLAEAANAAPKPPPGPRRSVLVIDATSVGGNDVGGRPAE